MLQALAVMFLVSVVVAGVWREWYAAVVFVLSGGVVAAAGTGLARAFTDVPDPDRFHGMVIAASGWLLVGTVGGLPFFLIAQVATVDATLPAVVSVPASETTPTLAAFRNPLNAVFESLSGFTGTGLTMTAHENRLPQSLQWWRSFTEWIGGVGVIVLTTAILARPGSGSLTLYESEARSQKIHPSIVSTVRTIWWIFLLYTGGSILLLWLAGMPPWDALNHAMTGLATGGFSITDNSIASYDSAVIDYALLPVMTLGSIAFPVHYLLLDGEWRQLYRDSQTRWVFVSFVVGSVVLTTLLTLNSTYESTTAAIRYGVFQYVSAMSCTGFQTASSLGTAWAAESKLTVTLAMVVGAAAGSTVGGIKLVRAITLSKGITYRIADVFYPESAVRTFSLDGRELSDTAATQEFEEAAIIALLWGVGLAVGTYVLLLSVPAEFSLADVLFEVASAQGNVGLSTGITGPTMPTPAKVVFLFNMWIGRLEIIPVAVLFRSLLFGTGVN
jgi:trk system potassium uptake protein TrkH